ncbi:alpha/beta hydrolase [Rhodosalinus halophilus]|nr:alpha/beta-hydrolase family protein [Rhodosalinus halophilus]
MTAQTDWMEEGTKPRDWRVSGVGLLVAALFFVASLTPSLIPREPVMQGALSGLSAALGYGIGSLMAWGWRMLLLPVLDGAAERQARYAMLIGALALAGWGLWRAPDWQNATRAAMDLPPVGTVHPVTVALVALVVFAALWLIGTAFTFVLRRAARALGRVMPGRTGPVLAFGLTVLLFWWAIEGVAVRNVLAAADGVFARIEATFDEGQEQPTDPMMTGSPGSPIAWEDLGNRGRDFIARTPSAEEIAAFWGEGAMRPVRVYVGRTSAPTPRARAELALQELIRTGGFEREILVITTPVGTGWMDPGSHDVLDFMWGGNTAQVAAQYSYLTSVLSILTNVEYGLDQARALFDVIYGHWVTLPPDARPRLYIHGLSQGALNSQATLPLLDVLGDPFDGAMWAGSPFVSPVWAEVRGKRAADSPAWRPRYGNGSLIRVTNQENVLDEAAAPWGPIRLVFLNYGSDPIVNFDFATIWRKPDFLDEPRAPDVAPEMRWFPFVTAFQIVLDMTTALGVERFGHFYVYEDYIPAWAATTNPPGWSAEREAALQSIFDERPPPW